MKVQQFLSMAMLAATVGVQAQNKEPLVLSAFEGDLARQWGGPHTKIEAATNPAFVKEGQQSGKWSNLTVNMWLTLLTCPPDWSAYDTLSFWMYADQASGEEFRISVGSETTQAEKGNYYLYTFKADWTGWKQFDIPFSEIRKIRSPVGWNTITGFTFSPARRGIASDLVFYLDDMRLTYTGKTAAPAEKPAEAGPDRTAALSARITQFTTGREGGTCPLVSGGADGRLQYAKDDDGNRLCDFSFAGYRGGGVAIPDVPEVLTVTPSGGDDTAALQAALDKLAALPLAPNGFRGALVLKKGKYIVTDSLFIRADGMVVRGAGAGFGGTWIYHQVMPKIKDPTACPMIHFPIPEKGVVPTFITIARNGETYPVGIEAKKVAEITTGLVPAGEASFEVNDASGLKPGAEVVVVCRHTQKWVEALKLDKVWKPENYMPQMLRVIAKVDGNRITLNVPVTTRIDAKNGYAVGEVGLCTDSRRLRNIGIEDILFIAGFDKTKKDKGGYYNDENHPNQAARFYGVRDGWVRRCVGFFYSAGFVAVGGSLHVTIEDCAMLDGVSLDTPVNHAGARKYYYNLNGYQCLVQRSYARSARHSFIGNGPYDGGVFLDCYAERDHLPSEWHQGWGHGHLFDSIALQGSIRMPSSTAMHGQCAAFALAWNCFIDNKRTFEADLAVTRRDSLCRNYAIGNILAGSGKVSTSTVLDQPAVGELGYVASSGAYVKPRSLYLAQLEDRLGLDAVKAVASEKQMTGERGVVWQELAALYAALPVYADPDAAPWPGLEDWIVHYRR